MIDLEARLRNGGLGGVSDFHAWEKKVLATEAIPELGALMKESTDNVLGKFLKGMLTKMGKKPKPPKDGNLGDLFDFMGDKKEGGEGIEYGGDCLFPSLAAQFVKKGVTRDNQGDKLV